MRFLILIVIVSLAACSSEEPPPLDAAAALPPGSYAGEGRDALCVSGSASAQRAGFVTYGKGDENCSAGGAIVKQSDGWTLTPQGDADCRIPLRFNAGRVALGPITPACAYYCAPGATFAGKSFNQSASAKPAADFGGDPLC